VLDNFKNFAKTTLAAGVAQSLNFLTLAPGTGARFPVPPFNAVIWNKTDYGDPADDPNVEIIRVMEWDDPDTVNAVRGQEGTADVDHNTVGKVYGFIAPLTAKTLMEDVGSGERWVWEYPTDMNTTDWINNWEVPAGKVFIPTHFYLLNAGPGTIGGGNSTMVYYADESETVFASASLAGLTSPDDVLIVRADRSIKMAAGDHLKVAFDIAYGSTQTVEVYIHGLLRDEE